MRQFELQQRLYSEEEYLEMDEKSEIPLEFFGGIIIPRGGGTLAHPELMAGATDKHVILATQSAIAVGRRLDDSNCQIGQSDLRVKLQGQKQFFYPDAVAWCEDARFEDTKRRTLLTPLLLIEVISASTGATDRGSKLEIYKQIPSLLDYLLISQTRVYIEHFRRIEGPRWENVSYHRRDQIIRLGFENLEIPAEEIYRRVDVPEQMTLGFEEE